MTSDERSDRRASDPRARRLEAAAERLAALARRVPDDVPAGRETARDPIALELATVVQELATANEQLRRQSAELERSKRLLAAERERYRELFEVAPEGHLATDALGTIREVNRTAAAILNMSAEYLVGKPLAVFVKPEDRPVFRTHVYRARMQGAEEAWKLTLTPRGGDEVRALVAVSPLLGSSGETSGLRWLVRDISERRAAQVWERTPAAVLRSAIDALSAHVAVLDVDGTIVTVNRAWRTSPSPTGVLGPSAIVGANYLDLCAAASERGRSGAAELRAAVSRVLHGGDPRAVALYSDAVDSTDDGESPPEAESLTQWYALRATRCDGPEPAMAVVTHEDVTTERRAYARERALMLERTARAEAEASSRAKSEFLATLSHELRTPLNAIAGYAQLMEMGVRGPVTVQQTEDLRRILRSEQHLLGLINELLNYARVERGDLGVDIRPVPIRDAARDVLELVEPQAVAKSIRLGIECPDAAAAALADADKLRQILLNLLTNALKFTPAGGSIRVDCGVAQETVTVQVHDTGIGIPEAQQHAVFDPFVQLHRGAGSSAEGIGLGLAISRGLARAMGGDLTVVSAPGRGSTFQLWLPRAEVRATL